MKTKLILAVVAGLTIGLIVFGDLGLGIIIAIVIGGIVFVANRR